MNLNTMKKRIDRIADRHGTGRFIVITASQCSDTEINEFLESKDIKIEPSDTILTIRRFAEPSMPEPQLLYTIFSDGTTSHASKEQKDAAVAAALMADS